MVDSSSEDNDCAGVGSFVDKLTDMAVESGITSVRIVGMTFGYTGKMLRFLKDKSAGIALPSSGIFTGGVLKKWGGERSTVKVNIAKTRRKMESIYLEIGKRGAKLPGDKDIAEHTSVKELTDEIKACESQIQRWETRLKEIDAERESSKRNRVTVTVDRRSANVRESIKAKIIEAGRSTTATTFASSSDKAIFDKVARDLMDDDIEIRLLATAELGKMGNAISIPLLKEAIGYGDGYLTSEIISALINIDDKSCLAIFIENIKDKNYRVRLGSMRGIYKVGGAGSVSYLIDGLKDEHPVVRKSVSTFLGWIGVNDAVPALIQSLKDSDQEVRKAAAMSLSILRDPSSIMPLIRILGESDMEVREKVVSAIERISGKTVEFKLDSSGDELRENIEGLKDWWQKNKMSDVADVLDSSADIASGDATAVADEEPLKTTFDETTSTIEVEETVDPIDDIIGLNDSDSDGGEDATVADDAPSVETSDSDEASTDADTDTSNDSDEDDDTVDLSKLNRMNKAALSAKCADLRIEYDDADTKAMLIEKINEKCGN
ncbi:MAG: HEAT repeat domain-containing protein [Candidatus Anammoxibacter sp.]